MAIRMAEDRNERCSIAASDSQKASGGIREPLVPKDAAKEPDNDHG